MLVFYWSFFVGLCWSFQLIDRYMDVVIGWYKFLFILAIFKDLNYINYTVGFGKTLWTLWYILYIVLSKGLNKTIWKLSKLFSIFVFWFIFQTQIHPVSVILLQCSSNAEVIVINTSLLWNNKLIEVRSKLLH